MLNRAGLMQRKIMTDPIEAQIIQKNAVSKQEFDYLESGSESQ